MEKEGNAPQNKVVQIAISDNHIAALDDLGNIYIADRGQFAWRSIPSPIPSDAATRQAER